MKLKNKISGEIKEFALFDGDELQGEATLESLTKEWEDVTEEPKEYWYIDWTPEIGVYHTRDVDSDADERQKEIGNYFETKEEAEKAMEKLKAWKRLKDKGFSFGRWQFLDDRSGIWVRGNLVPGIVDELDTLFGGEDE